MKPKIGILLPEDESEDLSLLLEEDEDANFECDICGKTYPVESHLSEYGMFCIICEEEEDEE